MKLSVIHISLSSSYGGGPEHVYQIISHHSSIKNLKTFIASPDDPPYGDIFKELVSDKSFYYKLPNRKLRINNLFGLAKFIKKNKIDLIHSHGKGSGIYGRIVSFITGIPCIHTPHGIHIGKYSRFQLFLYVLLEQFLSKITNYIVHVSVSEQVEASRLKLYRDAKFVIIENGVQIKEHNTNTETREKIRNEISENTNNLVVISVSRFDYQKNMKLAYEIAAACKNKEMIFVWIGEGEEWGGLKDKARIDGLDNIVFIGASRMVPEYLSAADVFLSTSRGEGMPLALLEAMASGLPIVASKVVGNKDVVDHNNNGYLFLLNDISNAVSYLENLQDTTLRHQLGSNARIKVKERFNVERMCKDIHNLYEDVILESNQKG